VGAQWPRQAQPPHFLAGWDPETQECDEGLVDGDLLLRAFLALPGRPAMGRSSTLRPCKFYVIVHDLPNATPFAEHAHPMAALALVAGKLGLLEDAPRHSDAQCAAIVEAMKKA